MPKRKSQPNIEYDELGEIRWFKNPLLFKTYVAIFCILVVSEILVFIVFYYLKKIEWFIIIIPETLIFFVCLTMFFTTTLKAPEYVGIGNKFIIFRHKRNRENIIHWEEVQTVDEVRQSDGFKSWAIVFKNYKVPKPGGDKITLGFISKDIVQKIHEAFTQYKKERNEGYPIFYLKTCYIMQTFSMHFEK